MAMMQALYQAGFHVITLPSPTTANFIISASKSCVPGDSTEDAADLYRVMEAAWNEVKGDIEVSSFHLGGYSQGAIQAAFVAKLDEERRVFNFRKVLMINPPVSVYDSAAKFEALLQKIPGGAKKQTDHGDQDHPIDANAASPEQVNAGLKKKQGKRQTGNQNGVRPGDLNHLSFDYFSWIGNHG